jgi:hypothetical protein
LGHIRSIERDVKIVAAQVRIYTGEEDEYALSLHLAVIV